MKKLLVLIIFVCVHFKLSAQSKTDLRKLSAAEIKYCNDLHAELAAAMPHVYNDWVFTDKAKDFNIQKMWCQSPSCIGNCPVAFGKTEPYSINADYEYKLNNNAMQANVMAAYKKITDFNNSSQIATALKTASGGKLAIHLTANMPSGNTENVLSYCSNTPLVSISLPVPATLAIMGLRSDACTIMTAGKADMNANYYDDALIFLGKPVIKKTTEVRNNTLSYTTYNIGFDKLKINQMITQNIVVSIEGDSADIAALVKLIDWQKLYSLIGK